MSWSMVSFRGYWAFAHDTQQDAFMEWAAAYLATLPAPPPWLLDLRRFWLESAGNQGNGASDIGVEDFLTDDGRVAEFRAFLRGYRDWAPASLAAYAETVDAVLTGDENNPAVHRG